MKKPVSFLIFILISLLFSVSSAFGQIQVRLRVIEASNVGTGIDSSLREEGGSLSSLFSFTSYRLLREETLGLFPNRPASIPVDSARSIDLTLIRQHRNTAEVRVKMRRQRTEILDTQIRLSPGRSVSIGGPKHGEGVMIITLSGYF